MAVEVGSRLYGIDLSGIVLQFGDYRVTQRGGACHEHRGLGDVDG